jgi:hypothetical protein
VASDASDRGRVAGSWRFTLHERAAVGELGISDGATVNKREASELLSVALRAYRALPYSDLVARIGAVESTTVIGSLDVEYQIEIQFLWDARPQGAIRVWGAIDDGRLRALFPLCDSFILAPDGTFVGEGDN